MNWRRVHHDGKDPKHYKEWRARRYRIVWRDQVHGVNVPPGFVVCVNVDMGGGRTMWDFVAGNKLRRTLKAAKRLCEQHHKDNQP